MGRSYTVVENMPKSPCSLELISIQPSEPDAPRRSVTLIVDESSTLSDRDKVVCLMAMVLSLQRNVFGDAWALAYYSAQSMSAEMGVSDEQFMEFAKMLESCRKRQAASNPISGMF